MEALGIRIDLPPAELEQCLERTNFAFFFAPRFYEATRFAMPARKKLGGKTVFNLLGPLCKPAGAKQQLVGVYAEKWVKPMSEALQKLGAQRALVIHGKDGTDEFSLTAETAAAELKEGQIRYAVFSPEQFGLQKAALKQFQCATKEKAVEAALSVVFVDNEITDSPVGLRIIGGSSEAQRNQGRVLVDRNRFYRCATGAVHALGARATPTGVPRDNRLAVAVLRNEFADCAAPAVVLQAAAGGPTGTPWNNVVVAKVADNKGLDGDNVQACDGVPGNRVEILPGSQAVRRAQDAILT